MTVSKPTDRVGGFSLVEVATSLTVLSIIVVSMGMSVMAGIDQRREALENYRALTSLRDLAAEIQGIANLDQDLASQEGIGAIYSRYDGQTVTVPGITNGQITITCYPNEATVPTDLGGPQDLNFDGDDDDNLGNVSAGTDLKLVPMTLRITFGDASDRTVDLHRLITVTRD